MEKIILDTNEYYKESCLRKAKELLGKFKDISEIKDSLDEINIYPNLSELKSPRNIFILDKVSDEDLEYAVNAVLDGKVIFEHTCAGEATRLGLGTKFLLNLHDLNISKIAEMISKENGKEVTVEFVQKEAGVMPEDLKPLSLGKRHMLQLSFDLSNLAEKAGRDPQKVLASQYLLVILNKKTEDTIINQFIDSKFFGFSPEKTLFMAQENYYGIKYDGVFTFDESSEKRLHNHGQMVMQETMDDSIFIIEGGNRKYLKAVAVGEILKKMEDKISYNIEDLGYLLSSIDFQSLAVALKKGKEGFRMMMEIVGNNPQSPQKGGMAAFDPVLGRNVMIEAFQLKGLPNSEIKYLNKNFNHYPMPYDSWKRIKDNGLNMPVVVKNERIYFQPVQGDINFLVKTEYVQRTELKPIQSWKSPATTPLALKYFSKQDKVIGFLEFSKRWCNED